MSAYTIRIPHTNPFPMFKTVNGIRAYTPFEDKMLGAQDRDFTQVWALTDRLSFQLSWFGAPLNASLITYVRFYVNGELRKTVTFNFGTTDVQGTAYTCYAKQRKVKGTSAYNGVFCFSQTLGDITDGDGDAMLSEGDCLQIRVSDPTGAVWESDHMDIIGDTDGTKLLHYSNTSDTEEIVFDTLFGYMPYGYDLRLSGYFSGFALATDMDLFDTSYGGKLMVQSTPKWTATLNLGADGVGIPLYYILLMNMVMSCDTKSLDGFGDFEFSDGGFDITANPDYCNDFYTATIVSKDNSLSQSSESVQGEFSIYAFVRYIGNGAFVEIAIESHNNGTWHLDAGTLTSNSAVQKLAGGDGKTKLTISCGVVTSESRVTVTALDAADNPLGAATVVLKATLKGLNHMAIGDSFIVK